MNLETGLELFGRFDSDAGLRGGELGRFKRALREGRVKVALRVRHTQELFSALLAAFVDSRADSDEHLWKQHTHQVVVVLAIGSRS